jgi:hypothetical protein
VVIKSPELPAASAGVVASAEADLADVWRQHHPERFPTINSADVQLDRESVEWQGRTVPYPQWHRETAAAVEAWLGRWREPLAAVGVAAELKPHPLFVWQTQLVPSPVPADPDAIESDGEEPGSPSAAAIAVFAYYGVAQSEGRKCRGDANPDDQSTAAAGLSPNVIGRAYEGKIDAVLRGLTRKQRGVAIDHWHHGMTGVQIAERLGTPDASRVSEMLARIRKKFDEAKVPMPEGALKRKRFAPTAADAVRASEHKGRPGVAAAARRRGADERGENEAA